MDQKPAGELGDKLSVFTTRNLLRLLYHHNRTIIRDFQNLAAYEAIGQSYQHRGHHIFYTDIGSGPVLLFLHGFPTSSWDWYRIAPSLAKKYRLIMPDFIGYGFSDKPRAYDYSLMDQTDMVLGLIQQLGITQFRVVSHDYGDTVGQELLARRAEGSWPNGVGEMQSVAMLNGGIIPGEHRPRPLQTLLASPLGAIVSRLINRQRFGKAFSAVFAPAFAPSKAELDDFWSLITRQNGIRIYHQLIRYMHERKRNYDRWVGVLREPPVPVLLINGLLDPVSGEHMVGVYESIALDPKVVRIPEAGHYPQVETPEAVLEALEEWLN